MDTKLRNINIHKFDMMSNKTGVIPMCDCCKSEGRDHKFHTGTGKVLQVRLFKVYMGKIAMIKLCKLCDIELFHIGESRFLKNHIQFTKELSVNQRQFT